MNYADLLRQVNSDIGGDLLILGIPIAVVITVLVQFCKMLKMPTQWAPWASVVIGFLAAIAVEATKPTLQWDTGTVVYTIMLGLSYSLMANGIFAMTVGTQDGIRLSRATQVTATVSMPPQNISVPVSPPAAPADVHVVGGGRPL